MASKFEYDDIVYNKLDQALNCLEGGHANPIMQKTAAKSIFEEWSKDSNKDKCFKRFTKYVLKTANFGATKSLQEKIKDTKNLRRRLEHAENRNDLLARVNKEQRTEIDNLNIQLNIAKKMLLKEFPNEEKKEQIKIN